MSLLGGTRKKKPSLFDGNAFDPILGGYAGGAPPGMGNAVDVQAPQPQPRWQDGGKFGVRDGIGLALGAIGDAFTQNAGGQPQFASNLMQGMQAQRQAKAAEEAYQRHRAEALTDYEKQQQLQQQYAPPKTNDTEVDLAFYKGLSDEDKAIYDQLHPVVIQGPNGPQLIPRSSLGGGLPHGYDPSEWEVVPGPQGGAQPQAMPPFAAQSPGTFPDPAGFHGGVMTSGRRTPQGNRIVGGAANSGHLRGDDIDYTPLPGETLGQTLQQVLQYYGPGAKAAIHKGTHVHTDLPGYGKVPYFGRRGTYGLR